MIAAIAPVRTLAGWMYKSEMVLKMAPVRVAAMDQMLASVSTFEIFLQMDHAMDWKEKFATVPRQPVQRFSMMGQQ